MKLHSYTFTWFRLILKFCEWTKTFKQEYFKSKPVWDVDEVFLKIYTVGILKMPK